MDWKTLPKEILKEEIRKKGVSTSWLEKSFVDNGIPETKASIDNKISRGSFNASFFLQCLHFLKNDESEKNIYQLDLFFKERKVFFDKKRKISFIDITKSQELKFYPNKVISLFSGAGGFDIGLELAGFETAVCVEIDSDCRETLRFNRPDWHLFEDDKNRIPGDIRAITGRELLKLAGLKKGEPALVIGGAPCQPFSNIGLKRGKNDPKNGDLFLEFVRIVKETQPKGLVFENVSGITQSKHQDVIKYMTQKFEELGYSVSCGLLNSADYGVPQKRERFFIIGLRGDQKPCFPLPTHSKSKKDWSDFLKNLSIQPQYLPFKWLSVGDALNSLPSNYFNRADFKVMNISPKVKERMKLIGPGENFKVLPVEMLPNCWSSGKHQGQDTFGRLRLDEPSVTIRTAAYNPAKGKYIHPTENRGLNTIEMAALQGFPYSWHFKLKNDRPMTLKSAGMQIGNAVPPNLAKAIGIALKIQLTQQE